MSGNSPSPQSRLSPLGWPRSILAGLIRVYQIVVSPLFGNRCRFYPSCSEYARDSILKYGVIRGSVLSVRRIFRCHPWNPGGYDPVK